MGGFQLLLGLLHCGLRTAQIRVSRGQIAAGVNGGDGHIYVGGRGIGLRAGQCCLGVLDRDLVVPGVQLGDGVARINHLVLFHIDLENLPRDARTHLDQVAVDLRVVGVLGEGRMPPKPGGNQHKHDNHDHNDASAVGLRLLHLYLCVRLGRDRCWSEIGHVYFPPR